MINNNILKNEISNYKEYENKNNKLLIQLEKLRKTNDNLIKDNNKFIKELKEIKNNQKIKDSLIKQQNVISLNLISPYKIFPYKKIKICNKINDIIIKGIDAINENKENNNNNKICSNINNFTLLKNGKI